MSKEPAEALVPLRWAQSIRAMKEEVKLVVSLASTMLASAAASFGTGGKSLENSDTVSFVAENRVNRVLIDELDRTFGVQ